MNPDTQADRDARHKARLDEIAARLTTAPARALGEARDFMEQHAVDASDRNFSHAMRLRDDASCILAIRALPRTTFVGV